jgi:hypothetical protein
VLSGHWSLLPQVLLQTRGVSVGVGVGERVGVRVPVGEGVGVLVMVGVGEDDGVGVLVGDGVEVGTTTENSNIHSPEVIGSAALGLLSGAVGAIGFLTLTRVATQTAVPPKIRMIITRKMAVIFLRLVIVIDRLQRLLCVLLVR